MNQEHINKIYRQIAAKKSLITEKETELETLIDELENLQSELNDAYNGSPFARMDYVKEDR
jgi:uncharacterized coiled-coil protein SlyX